MKAAYLVEKEKINIEDIDIYKIADGDILMKMGAASICGTDIRIYKNGHFKIPNGTKRVLGHELCGEIVQIGKNVKNYKVGMRIALAPNVGCGVCDECIKGYINICSAYHAFGVTMDGGFQEYVLIPEFSVKSGCIAIIPDNLTFEEASLAEPLSCVLNSYNHGKTNPGDTVLIVGAGPIGALHTALQRNSGAAKIIVADISPARLSAVKQFGADIIIDCAKNDLKKEVMRYTDNKGSDIVVTAASVGALQTQALELAAKCGKVCFFGGLPSGHDRVELSTNLIHYRQLSVYATTGSTYTDHRASLNLIASGRINVKALISERFSVSQTKEAFKYAISGAGMKTFVMG